MKNPYYKWYPGKHHEIKTMNHEVHSCYRLLWDAALELLGLPTDLESLAGICKDYPLPEFKKLWTRLEDYFSEVNGVLLPNELVDQIKNSKKLSKRNQERAIAMWQKRREKMPAAYQNEAETAPKKTQVDVGGQPKMPAAYRNGTKKMPFVSRKEIFPQPLQDHTTEPMPPVYQTDTEKEPEILTIPAPEPEKENAVIPVLNETKEKLSSGSVIRNEVLNDFDPLAAWEKFAEAWGRGILEDQESKEWFFREIVNLHLNTRLARAAERYLASLSPGWEPMAFIFWTAEWTDDEG